MEINNNYNALGIDKQKYTIYNKNLSLKSSFFSQLNKPYQNNLNLTNESDQISDLISYLKVPIKKLEVINNNNNTLLENINDIKKAKFFLDLSSEIRRNIISFIDKVTNYNL